MENINISIVAFYIFALAHTVSERLLFEIIDIEKVVQGHGVLHSQLRYSIGKIKKINRSRPKHFFRIRCQILNSKLAYERFDLDNNRLMSRITTFAMATFGGKYQILKKAYASFFVLALTVSEIKTFDIFDFKNVFQGHGMLFSQWHHSIANIRL